MSDSAGQSCRAIKFLPPWCGVALSSRCVFFRFDDRHCGRRRRNCLHCLRGAQSSNQICSLCPQSLRHWNFHANADPETENTAVIVLEWPSLFSACGNSSHSLSDSLSRPRGPSNVSGLRVRIVKSARSDKRKISFRGVFHKKFAHRPCRIPAGRPTGMNCGSVRPASRIWAVRSHRKTDIQELNVERPWSNRVVCAVGQSLAVGLRGIDNEGA